MTTSGYCTFCQQWGASWNLQWAARDQASRWQQTGALLPDPELRMWRRPCL